MPGPSNIGASGDREAESRSLDAVCAPLDTMLVRVSRLDREELRDAVASILDPSASAAEQGWNLYAPAGSPVYSVTRGIVRELNSWRRQVSLAIELQAPAATRLAMAHGARRLIAAYDGLGTVAVAVGDIVPAGAIIGSVAVFPASPPHLHFELHTSLRGGKRIDPRELLGRPETEVGAACG